MNSKFLAPLISSIFLGCTTNGENPSSYVVVGTTPEGYTIPWSSDDNSINLSGRVLYFDVWTVQNLKPKWQGVSYPMPQDNVKVEVTSLYDGVYILPQEAIELVSYPGLPGNIESVADVRDQCVDENNYYSHDAGDWCAWYWDTTTNRFYQFNGTYADAYAEINDTGICGANNTPCDYFYGPTHLIGTTNNRGLLRVYLMVDALPEAAGTIQPVDVLITTGFSSTVLTITPLGSG